MILGAQLFTLRNFCKTPEDLDATLKKVADIGFTAVQLSGVCAYDAEWVAERCREYGLKIVITHFDYNKIINETEETIANGTLCCIEISIEHMTGKIGLEVLRERTGAGDA